MKYQLWRLANAVATWCENGDDTYQQQRDKYRKFKQTSVLVGELEALQQDLERYKDIPHHLRSLQFSFTRDIPDSDSDFLFSFYRYCPNYLSNLVQKVRQVILREEDES